MKSDRYYLTYNVVSHPEGLTAKQVEDLGLGGTHQLVLISKMLTGDGGGSYALMSLDGADDEPLDAEGLFGAWAYMAHALVPELEEGSWQRTVCDAAFQAVRHAVLLGRASEGAEGNGKEGDDDGDLPRGDTGDTPGRDDTPGDG